MELLEEYTDKLNLQINNSFQLTPMLGQSQVYRIPWILSIEILSAKETVTLSSLKVKKL